MSHVGSSSPSGSSGPSGVSRSPSQDFRCRSLAGPGLARAGDRASSAGPRSLSDRELLSRVKDLVSRERAVTLEILVHLIEVERRRLHLGLGCASMFDYCTRHLGYSSSAASRRIQSARCIRGYPEVYGLLEKNEVNLGTVSLVASILTRENKADLLSRIRSKSQKEVEAIVADHRPPVSLRDRARPVCVAVSDSRGSRTAGLPLTGTASTPVVEGHKGSPTLTAGSEEACQSFATQRASESDHSRCGSEKRPNSMDGPLRFERKFQVQFLASDRFMEKFERAKALLSNKNGKPSYEFVLGAALDEFLKYHDPENRKQRREERKEKADARSKPAMGGNGEAVRREDAERFARRWQRPDTWGAVPTSAPCEWTPAVRHIPVATRDAVFARDKGRCTFMGSTGKRCDATHNLQIDHIVPFARGGTNTLDNLRLLCERHNKAEAERVLGANTVQRFRRRE